MYIAVLMFGNSDVSCTDDNTQDWCIVRDSHQIYFNIEFDEYTPVAPLPGQLVPEGTYAFDKNKLPFYWVCDFGTESSFYSWLDGDMNNVPVTLFQVLAPASADTLIDKVYEARSLSVGVDGAGNIVYIKPDGSYFETYLQQDTRQNKSLFGGSFKGGAAKGKLVTVTMLLALGYAYKKWKRA